MPRRPSPLRGRRPTKDDLADVPTTDPDVIDDLLPDPSADPALRLLIVGINPGLWTAAVNAPFARPGNRFWPSLHAAGLTARPVDASRGLEDEDAADLLGRGVGVTNLVGRATARADQLRREELREGGAELLSRLPALAPRVVAIAGITAYRQAFDLPKARLGRQEEALPDGWPEGPTLWVVPQPSGLNAHATIASLAATWREVAAEAAVPLAEHA
ncbi:mismatch-specific DNA-glycosylase [Brachybacterium horti]